MRPLLSLAILALASTLLASSGCASAPPAIFTRPTSDPTLAAAPTRSADVRVEAVLVEVDAATLDALLATPLDAFCAAGRVGRAEREALLSLAARAVARQAVTLRSGQRGKLMAIEQRAYIGDWRIYEGGPTPTAQPSIEICNTGVILGVVPEAREGAISLEVSLDTAWDLGPARVVVVTLRDREGRPLATDVPLEIPDVVTRSVARRFDLAPGEAALFTVRRGDAGVPWVVLLTAAAGA